MSSYPIKSPKKLIEVALPLDAINRAAARAVIFAQLVNDPGFQRGGGFSTGWRGGRRRRWVHEQAFALDLREFRADLPRYSPRRVQEAL